jgi:transposase InsO family protein
MKRKRFTEEQIAFALRQWAYLNGVEIDVARPGKPTDNAFIEALNARARRVPQCVVVPVHGRCPRPDRRMEVPVQRRSTSLSTR